MPLLAVLCPLVACATTRDAPRSDRAACPTEAAPAELPPEHGRRPHHRFNLPKRIVDGKKGGVLDPSAVFDDLATARVVYVSEHHDDPHHHAVQVSIIAELYRRDPALAIGLEMIKAPFQGALDRYAAGEIDEETFLRETEWEERWGFDFALYRPILEFARAHRVRLIALNAPDELTRKVAQEGLAGLSKVERAALPELDLSQADHRARLREVFESHHAGVASAFEHFYAAQVIWDETMAENVARVLSEKDGPRRVVVLAGDGHVRHRSGIPARAARRGATPFRTVVPIALKDLEETIPEDAADYLWVLAKREADLAELDGRSPPTP